MYAQLGNIVFSSQNGFTSFSVDGDEANFAEFELINSKTRLQKTGDTLQELSIGIKLHSKFVNVDNTLATLSAHKTAGDVLPLLMGNGKYIGDYVVLAMPYTVDDAFSDGSIIEATLSLTLLEYVSFNKLEQKKVAARKNAFAVGDKKPVITRPPQPERPSVQLSKKVIEAQQQANKIDNQVGEFESNVSARAVIAKRITDTCEKGTKALSEFNEMIDNVQDLKDRFLYLKDIASSVSSAFTAIKNQTPFNSVSDLRIGNTALQSVTRTFNTSSIPLMEDVIIRK